MKTILCYGDSNTYGLRPDSNQRYPREIRWTGLLQKSLGEDYYVIEDGLSGRTTLWDDPIEEHKNGKTYLFPCLESHSPIDLVVLMLGTNDLKTRFSLTPFDIGASVENLVKCILKSEAGPDGQPPKILLISPAPIHSVGRDDLDNMFLDMEERSRALAHYYEIVANQHSVAFLDPKDVVETNELDGIHYSVRGHAVMAELVEKKVREILG